MNAEIDALRREIAELRASQLQLADVRSYLEGSPMPSAQNMVEPHSVRDNAIGMLPFCYVRKTANQLFGAAAGGLVTWDSASTSESMGDPYGMHIAAANTRITVPRDGWYLAFAQIGWDPATTTGSRKIVDILKNNVFDGEAARVEQDSTAAGEPCQIVTGLFYMRASDYLVVSVYNGDSVGKNVLGAPNDSRRSKFAVIWQHHNVFS